MGRLSQPPGIASRLNQIHARSIAVKATPIPVRAGADKDRYALGFLAFLPQLFCTTSDKACNGSRTIELNNILSITTLNTEFAAWPELPAPDRHGWPLSSRQFVRLQRSAFDPALIRIANCGVFDTEVLKLRRIVTPDSPYLSHRHQVHKPALPRLIG